MRHGVLKPLMRALVALALIFQAGLPASAALAAERDGFDVANFVCGQGGQPPSARTLEMAHQLEHLLGHDDQQGGAHSEGCPFCVLAHAAPLPIADLPAAPQEFSYLPEKAARSDAVVYAPRGPPVGSQGPPTTLNV